MAPTIQWGNPIIITSGFDNSLLEPVSGEGGQRIKVKIVQWLQPDLTSTSSLMITKAGTSAPYLTLRAEVSGQSQLIELNQWWNNAFIDCIPSGTLQIYLW